MIWGEQYIRDRVRVGVGAACSKSEYSTITCREVESLLNEIDRLRRLMQRVKEEAELQAMSGIAYLADEALK